MTGSLGASEVVSQSSRQPKFNIRELFAAWDKFVAAYAICGLTMEKDKLAAISGVVKEIEGETGDEWLCGFWKNHLPKKLLWRTEWSHSYILDRRLLPP